MAFALTSASVMTCPHGGKVVPVPGNLRSRAGAAALLRAADRFTVVGCPFTLPGPTYSPCLSVDWLRADPRAGGAGGGLLTTASVGICRAGSGAPQGRVQVVATQARIATGG
jgi:hypothetical protein